MGRAERPTATYSSVVRPIARTGRRQPRRGATGRPARPAPAADNHPGTPSLVRHSVRRAGPDRPVDSRRPVPAVTEPIREKTNCTRLGLRIGLRIGRTCRTWIRIAVGSNTGGDAVDRTGAATGHSSPVCPPHPAAPVGNGTGDQPEPDRVRGGGRDRTPRSNAGDGARTDGIRVERVRSRPERDGPSLWERAGRSLPERDGRRRSERDGGTATGRILAWSTGRSVRRIPPVRPPLGRSYRCDSDRSSP